MECAPFLLTMSDQDDDITRYSQDSPSNDRLTMCYVIVMYVQVMFHTFTSSGELSERHQRPTPRTSFITLCFLAPITLDKQGHPTNVYADLC